jgi:ABC-2 type transport system permease protein
MKGEAGVKAKNRSIYFYVYKTQIIKSMAYKFDVYGNIIMQTIIMVALAFFWRALFKNADSVQGVTVDTMLTYTVVSSMISVVLTTNVERRITRSVRKGTIAVDMMRPVNIFSVFFAENIGGVTALIFQNLLPIFLIGGLFIKFPVPCSGVGFLLFLCSLSLAFFVNWYLAALFGMLAFSVIEMDALLQVKKHLIRLLSGSIIPIWFFPDWFQGILQVLPFVYLYQMPLDIYIGKYTNESLIRGLVIQCIWMIALMGVYRCMQKKVTGKIMIQGG